MTFTDYKEAKAILGELVAETYGTISKHDMKDFINFLREDKELKEEGWKLGEALPFDIEELVENFIKKDTAYNLH